MTANYRDIIVTAFNRLTKNTIDSIEDFYSKDIVFEDPLGKVDGLENVKKYYRNVYRNVSEIKFEFAEMIIQQGTVAAPWIMTLSARGLNSGKPFAVKGLSILVFNSAQKVCKHTDYVDMGQMVYLRLPFVGAVIRKINSKLSHS
jgi:hypothetical protein